MLLVVTSFLLPPTAGEKITLNSICFLGIDHTYHTQHVWSSYGAPQFTNCTWSTCTLTFYALSYPNHAVKNTLFVLSYPNHGPQFAASTWSTSNQACRQWPTTCLLFSSSTQIRLDLDDIVGDADNGDGNDKEDELIQYAENLMDENPT